MTKFLHGVLFILAAFAMTLPAHAGKGGGTVPPTIEKSGRNDNTVYVGINWNFGVRDGATAVLGYRDAKVKANGNVEGFDANANVSGYNGGNQAKIALASIAYAIAKRDERAISQFANGITISGRFGQVKDQ